jgi:prolyl-tRNA editing enzyme YbaK/EbsC (Cys-tRNA(Pro) deacylase)
VVFNAGSHARSITMRCTDLVRISGATVCRFAVVEAPA